MSRAARLLLFLGAAGAFLGAYLQALRGLPAFGYYQGPYGDVLNHTAVGERRVTDLVTAVNFDYRGFDTLGEEFILFGSVAGALLLLRRKEGEKEAGKEEDHGRRARPPEPSEATRVLALGLTGTLVVFGLYIVTHGQLSPGGGFQGGVLLSTAPLLVYLGGGFQAFKRITSHGLLEAAEAAGAGGFLVVGFAGLAAGAKYLENVLPLGTLGDVFSGGTIPLISLATGLEVAAGFTLLLRAFLEQALELQGGDGR